MNEDNTHDHTAPVVPPTPAADAAQSAEQAAAPAPSAADAAADGHSMPPTFTSPAPAQASASAPAAPAASTSDAQAPSAQTPAVSAPVPPHAAPVPPYSAPSGDGGAYTAPAHTAPAHTASAHPAPSQPAPAESPTAPYGAAPYGSAPYGSASAPGAAFGIPASHGATQPTQPIGDGALHGQGPAAAGVKTKDAKPRSGVKVAALLLAAALVGGAAGVGGSAISNAITNQHSTGTASGPETVTVNNPGSVNETTAVATKALPSVVTIEVAGSKEAGSGSGVILSDDGYVLTNTHVVTLGGAVADPTIRVTTSDGRIFEATVVGTDPMYDLAVIKLKGAKDLTPIEFADSSKLNVGDTAVALGAPLGLANSVTTGVVSALNRSIQIASSAVPDTSSDDAPQEQTPEDQGQGGPFQFDLPGSSQQQPSSSISVAVIQTDAAINHGNSGGALVNSKGELIGINVAIASSGNSEDSGSIGLGFSIPSNIAKRVSGEIIKDGKATHGLLGASVQDAASVEGAKVSGAYIKETTSGGAGEAGGLKAGDIVTAFNGVPVTSASDLTAQVRAAAAGSKATVTYVRGGREYEAEVTLGELAG